MDALGGVVWPTRMTLLAWGAMLALGSGMWESSGTPLAGAAIVVAVLLAIASPPGALYATCASIPLVFHPIAIGSLELSLLELGILTTAVGAGFRSLFDLASGGPSFNRDFLRPWSTWLLVILLLVVGTASLVWMPFDLHRAEALRTWRWVIVEPLIVFGLARLTIARDGRSWLVVALCLPATMVAVAALAQFVSASSNFAVDSVHRSTATYLHPNNLALYLERILFLGLAPAMLLRSRFRPLFVACTGLLLLALGTTFSRGVFPGIAIGGAVLLAVRPLRRGWSVLGFGLAGAGILFGLLASQRLVGAGSSGLGTTRRFLWRDSIHMLRDFPWSGVGLDQFLWLHQQRYIDPRIWSERYTSHPHNLVLDAWLSLGIAGLTTLLVFLGVGVWFIWTARKKQRSVDVWQLGALSSLGVGLGHGLVDNGYFLPDLAVLTWLCIALIGSRTSRPDSESIDQRHD